MVDPLMLLENDSLFLQPTLVHELKIQWNSSSTEYSSLNITSVMKLVYSALIIPNNLSFCFIIHCSPTMHTHNLCEMLKHVKDFCPWVSQSWSVSGMVYEQLIGFTTSMCWYPIPPFHPAFSYLRNFHPDHPWRNLAQQSMPLTAAVLLPLTRPERRATKLRCKDFL